MLGLTSLGVFHTAISLLALLAALVMLVRDRKITGRGGWGGLYVVTTLVTCLTAFGIFKHGTFGAPHVLGVVTLVTLGVSWLAGSTRRLGRAAPYVETVGYSATFLFHLIPAITETSTRLPVGAPLASSAEDPGLQTATAVLFLAFLVGATWQVLQLRAARRTGAIA